MKLLPCPHCGQEIAIQVDSSVVFHLPDEQSDGAPDALEFWWSKLDAVSRDVVEAARKNGVVAPFVAAFSASHGMVPKIPEKALLAWIRTTKPSSIPRFALEYFLNEFGADARLTYVSSQRVGAVLTDNSLRCFVPEEAIKGHHAKSAAHGIKMRIGEGDLRGLLDWTRTRYGYVIGKGAMWTALRRKSYGDFARPMVESTKEVGSK